MLRTVNEVEKMWRGTSASESLENRKSRSKLRTRTKRRKLNLLRVLNDSREVTKTYHKQDVLKCNYREEKRFTPTLPTNGGIVVKMSKIECKLKMNLRAD